MSIEKEPEIVCLSRAVYSRLLIFYPRDLRHKFGAEMADGAQAGHRPASL